MLIVTRRPGQVLHIGEDIQVVFIRKSKGSNQIVLGIDAPEHINIYREEAKKKTKKEKSKNNGEVNLSQQVANVFNLDVEVIDLDTETRTINSSLIVKPEKKEMKSGATGE